MIKVTHVDKSFDDLKALDDLSMSVHKGSIYGLIGPNGSGKTTLIKHLAGVLKQDDGEVFIDDQPVYENVAMKRLIGMIPDEMYVPHGYSLDDMRALYRSLYPTFSDDRYIEMVTMMKLNRRKKIQSMSKGMKKQAVFCIVMAAMPQVLLLDEPFDGLDPIVRKIIKHFLIEDVAERQTTVLISSHNLRELEELCDAVGIIKNGHMLLERDLDDLRTDVHKIQVALPQGEDRSYEALNVLYQETTGSMDQLIIKDNIDHIKDVIEAKNPLVFDVLPLSLEEVFIYELGGDDHDIKKLIF